MRLLPTLVATTLLAAGCGTPVIYEVSEGTYRSLVPSVEQLGLDSAASLPGGLQRLRADGVDTIELVIGAEEVIFRVDGNDAVTRAITGRVEIEDSEGSGPFKARKQILVLRDTPLVLGGLVIDDPVIWPGSFDGSPVITVKPRDPDERGPVVSCRGDEPCLLFSSGVEPTGRYADANDPALGENPIDSILIDDRSIEFNLDAGEQITIPASTELATRACGLSENPVWALPAEIGLAIDDPVLVHTVCPSTPGAVFQLEIMGRDALPLLAPLTDATEGDWCGVGAECLLFVPE